MLLMGLVNLLLLLVALVSIFGTFPDNFFPFLPSVQSIYRNPCFLLLLGAFFPLTIFIIGKRSTALIRARKQEIFVSAEKDPAVLEQHKIPLDFSKIITLKDSIIHNLKLRHLDLILTSREPVSFNFYAVRNWWANWSSVLIHVGFLMVLVGGVCTFLFADIQDVMIREGETIELSNTQSKLKLEKFTILLHPVTNKVKEYISRFLVEERPGVIMHRDLRVNHPLSIQGTKIFQMRYSLEVENIEIVVLEGEKPIGTLRLKPGIPSIFNVDKTELKIEAGEVVPDFVINEKGEYSTRSSIFRNPAVLLLFYDSKIPDRVIDRKWVFQDAFSHAPKQKSGKTFGLGGITKYYKTGLKLSRDPGVPAAYLGFLFLIIGTFISSFIIPRCMILKFSNIAEVSSGTLLEIHAGKSKDTVGLEREIKSLAGDLVRCLTKEK